MTTAHLSFFFSIALTFFFHSFPMSVFLDCTLPPPVLSITVPHEQPAIHFSYYQTTLTYHLTLFLPVWEPQQRQTRYMPCKAFPKAVNGDELSGFVGAFQCTSSGLVCSEVKPFSLLMSPSCRLKDTCFTCCTKKHIPLMFFLTLEKYGDPVQFNQSCNVVQYSSH